MSLPIPLSEPGPLLTYIMRARGMDPKKIDGAIAAIRTMLSTSEGAIFLEMLENATLNWRVPVLADDRALAAKNAQSFIALDLRRILSDETEQLLERQKGVERT